MVEEKQLLVENISIKLILGSQQVPFFNNQRI